MVPEFSLHSNCPAVSIIVPVYNAEQYLRRCLNCIKNQIFTSYEVLLVNDGSTDTSGQIIREYESEDDRFQSVFISHAGVSAARNIGISRARGKYYAFIDADDMVNAYFLDILYRMITGSRADIAVCRIAHRRIPMKSVSHVKNRTFMMKVVSGRQLLMAMGQPEYYENAVVCWNKLYRAEVFDSFRFPEGRIYEDSAAVYRLLYSAQRVAITDKVMYWYNTESPGITRKPYSSASLDEVIAAEERMLFFAEHREKWLYSLSRKQYCVELLKHYYQCRNCCKERGLMHINAGLLKAEIFRYCMGYSWKKSLSLPVRCAFLAGTIFPYLTGLGIYQYARFLERVVKQRCRVDI